MKSRTHFISINYNIKFAAQFLLAIAFLLVSLGKAFAFEKGTWEDYESRAEQSFVDGKYKQSEVLWMKALEVAESDKSKILNVATTLNQLNHLFMLTKQYERAHKFLTRAYEIRKKHLGSDNILTAETLGNLALVSHKLGHDHEAEELYLESLAIKEKVDGKDSPECATTLHNLANLYSLRRDYNKAKEMYQKVLEIDKKKHGDNHVEVVRDLTSLGINEFRCGYFEKAIGFLETANTIAAEQDKPFKIELIPIYHYLGLSYGELNKHEKSKEFHQLAHQLGHEVHGKHYPANTIALLNLAESLDKAGDSKEAERVYLKALAHEQERKTVDPYLMTEVNVELAQYYHRHDFDDEADRIYAQAILTYEKLPEHLRRKLYELPLAYSDLLVKIGKAEEAKRIKHKYLHVHTPSKDKHFRME